MFLHLHACGNDQLASSIHRQQNLRGTGGMCPPKISTHHVQVYWQSLQPSLLMLQDSSFAGVLPVPTPSHLTKDLASRAVSEFAELCPPNCIFIWK